MTPALRTKRLRLYAPHHRVFNIERQVEWLNDKHVVKYSEQRHREHTWDSQWKFLCSFNHVTSHFWEISHTYGCYDYPIGTITAYRDMMNKVADIGIMIGNRNIWGNGYGSEAWQAVMDYLFSDGIEKIEAGAVEVNQGMLKIMHKCGMLQEGVRRNHAVIDGKPFDTILMGKIKWNPMSE